jgi:hypothetical protein
MLKAQVFICAAAVYAPYLRKDPPDPLACHRLLPVLAVMALSQEPDHSNFHLQNSKLRVDKLMI